MTPRLRAAIEGISDGALQMPMTFETGDGGVAVLVPVMIEVQGHTEFPRSIDFEITVLDAMGDIVTQAVKTYR